MIALVCGVAGFVVALALLRAMARVLAHPTLERTNHRGASLPTAAGLLLVVAVIAVEAAHGFVRLVQDEAAIATLPRVLVLVAVIAFGLLGFIDDVIGDGSARGFRGHLAAAARGTITTGLLKLVGGGAVGFVIAGVAARDLGARVIVDALVVALAANLGNLFDRAPGRTGKVAIVTSVGVFAVASTAVAIALAPVVGAAVALLSGDLRERYMLGDTGANALGAALGTAVVLSVSTGARVGVLVALVALTLASEAVSFSRVIAAVAPLRALDALGQLKDAQ